MDSNTREVTANIRDDEQLKVVKARKEEKPFFHMVGTGKERKGTKTEPVNFIKVIISMTKAEQFVIKTIMDELKYDDKIGEVYISTGIFNDSEKQKWKKGMSILKSKKLVGSRKTSHFIINPNALIPKEYQEALKIWHKIYSYHDFKL